MKKYIKLVFICLLTLGYINIYGQTDRFYYSDNSKILLTELKNEIAVTSSDKYQIFKSINRRATIDSLQQKGVDGLKVFKTKGSDSRIIMPQEVLIKTDQIKSVEKFLRKSKMKGVTVIPKKYGVYKLTIPDHLDALTVANSIYESNLVAYSHPNMIAPIAKNSDPLFVFQYYLKNTANPDKDIDAEDAWDHVNKFSPQTVRVAVIDDGVEAHADLPTVLNGFTPLIATGNGSNGAPNNADDGHGQACAGIIGAVHNNIFMSGVALNVEIVPVNIFVGTETAGDIADAIDFAWDDAGADVLSNSWNYNTSGTPFDAIIDAIGRARTQGRGGLGSIVVFSSGNNHNSFNGVSFPANVNGVVTVGAMKKAGGIWGYSSRGADMDVVAPTGDVNLNGDVYTLDREGTNGYNNNDHMTNFGGTSAAAPQVAGIAALMLSLDPELTEGQVTTSIRNTALDQGSSGFDNTYGFGLVNAFEAVKSVCAAPFTNTTISSDMIIKACLGYKLTNVTLGNNVDLEINCVGEFSIENGFQTGTNVTLDIKPN